MSLAATGQARLAGLAAGFWPDLWPELWLASRPL
jgi:hypothetical protein